MSCASYYLSISRALVTPNGIENLTSFHISGPYMVEGHLIVLSKFVLFNSTSLDRSAPIIRVIVYHAAARCSIACQWGVSRKLILGGDQGMRCCGIRCSSSHKFSVASRVKSITPAHNNSVYSYCGGLYNLNISELQTTETDLRCIQGERGRIGRLPNSLTTMPWQGKPRLDRAECV